MKKLLFILGVSSFGMIMGDDSKGDALNQMQQGLVESQPGTQCLVRGPRSTKQLPISKKTSFSRSGLLVSRGRQPRTGISPLSALNSYPNNSLALDLASPKVVQHGQNRVKLQRAYTTYGLPLKEQVKFYTQEGIQTDLNHLASRISKKPSVAPKKELSVRSSSPETLSVENCMMESCCCGCYRTLWGWVLQQVDGQRQQKKGLNE